MDEERRGAGSKVPMILGAGLLVVAASLLGLRGCKPGDAGAVDGNVHRASGRASEDGIGRAESNGSSRSRRLTAEQAKARVNSLLAVGPGEIGAIGIPAGALEQYFQAAESGDGGLQPGGEGAISPYGIVSIISPGLAQRSLEAILLSGGELSGRLGKVEEGIIVSGDQVSVAVKVKREDGPVSDLEIVARDGDGRRRLQTGVTAYKGYAVIFRSADPEPEAWLILVGKDEEKASK